MKHVVSIDALLGRDVTPPRLLKTAVDVISPYLAELFNRSPFFGNVVDETHDVFKISHISARLKNVELDSTDVRSYHPISSRNVLAKLMERLIAHQLKVYLDSCGLFPRLQPPIELTTPLRLLY